MHDISPDHHYIGFNYADDAGNEGKIYLSGLKNVLKLHYFPKVDDPAIEPVQERLPDGKTAEDILQFEEIDGSLISNIQYDNRANWSRYVAEWHDGQLLLGRLSSNGKLHKPYKQIFRWDDDKKKKKWEEIKDPSVTINNWPQENAWPMQPPKGC